MSTLHDLGDVSEDLIRLLTPRLDSEDFVERVTAAGNLWRINRSEKALAILQEGDPYDMAQDYLDEVEFPIRNELPADRVTLWRWRLLDGNGTCGECHEDCDWTSGVFTAVYGVGVNLITNLDLKDSWPI